VRADDDVLLLLDRLDATCSTRKRYRHPQHRTELAEFTYSNAFGGGITEEI